MRRSPTIIAWRQATRQWWDRYRGSYSLCTSAYVLEELERTPGPRAALALELVKDLPLLELPSRLDEVVEAYIRNQLMPRDARGDAAHLAMVSLHSIDFLLTWNCRHLANANKIEHLRVINTRLKLTVPVLTTPMTLVPEGAP